MARVASIFFLILLSSQLIVPYNGLPLEDLGPESSERSDTEKRGEEKGSADGEKTSAAENRLRNHIEQYVEEFFRPYRLRHSWSLFGDDWGLDTPHWSNLGERIWKQVEESMKPLYEMQLRLQMKNGECGNTVVTFRPDGKTLLLKDDKPFECPGEISESGTCSAELKPFKLERDTDKCFLTPKVIFNDQLCLTTDDIVSVTSTPSEGLNCRNKNGDKIEPTRLKEYQELCENLAKEAEYKYVTDNKINPDILPEDIQCSVATKAEKNTTTCTFTDKDRLTKNTARLVYSSKFIAMT